MNDSKANILRAASELFRSGGTAALSVRAIAKQAGVSTIGIYSHFQGKQGILDALYIEGFESVARAMDVRTDRLTPHKAVLLAAENYLNIAERFEAHYSLIFGKLDDTYTPSPDAQAASVQAFNRLTELVGALLPAAAALAEHRDAAIQVWSLLHGSVSLNSHAVSKLVATPDWKTRTLRAVECLVEAISHTNKLPT